MVDVVPLRLMPCCASGHGPCDSARQDHHVVKQQRIRRRWATLKAEHRRGGPKPWQLGQALEDIRNKVKVCWRHHKPVEEELIPIALPTGFWDYVHEYGLAPDLPRYLKGDPRAGRN